MVAFWNRMLIIIVIDSKDDLLDCFIDFSFSSHLQQTFTAVNTWQSKEAISFKQFTNITFTTSYIKNLGFKSVHRAKFMYEESADLWREACAHILVLIFGWYSFKTWSHCQITEYTLLLLFFFLSILTQSFTFLSRWCWTLSFIFSF